MDRITKLRKTNGRCVRIDSLKGRSIKLDFRSLFEKLYSKKSGKKYWYPRKIKSTHTKLLNLALNGLDITIDKTAKTSPIEDPERTAENKNGI